MACRSFNSPIARARFCVSARMIDPRRSRADSSPLPPLPPLFAPLSHLANTPGSVPSNRLRSLEMLCNLRFWLMLPSRWSNDRSIGSGLPSLPISAARPLSALRRYFRYYDSSRMCRAATIDPGSGDLDGFRILRDHRWRTCCRRPWRFCLNSIGSRRYFENVVCVAEIISKASLFVARISKFLVCRCDI